MKLNVACIAEQRKTFEKVWNFEVFKVSSDIFRLVFQPYSIAVVSCSF